MAAKNKSMKQRCCDNHQNQTRLYRQAYRKRKRERERQRGEKLKNSSCLIFLLNFLSASSPTPSSILSIEQIRRNNKPLTICQNTLKLLSMVTYVNRDAKLSFLAFFAHLTRFKIDCHCNITPLLMSIIIVVQKEPFGLGNQCHVT